MKVEFSVNGEPRTVDVPGDKPVLWVVREDLKLTASKFGCGIGQCGACTVLLDGNMMRSCGLPVSAVAGREITTLEGADDAVAKAVRDAWRALDVVQCGYCQSGQMMSAIALLRSNPSPDDAAIDAAMSGNLCRCATYQRIRKAIHQAAGELGGAA
ncbi:MAG: (2Fe-2S)-binding protein [Pseudomonadota bacterium]